MAFLSFSSLAEFVAFFTSFLVGISMIMGVNAVNSAPSFMLNYFQYIARDEYAVAKNPKFWTNVLTYYTVVTQVTQTLLEPINLTPLLQRFSLIFRMQVATILMLIELLVVMIMPHTCRSETGAMAGIMIAAFIGGAGRAYVENSSYALFGPFPPKFVASLLGGVPLSGAIVSILQIILLGAMENTYDSILTQSIIYFAISLFLIFLSAVCLALLVYNPYARRFVTELRWERGLCYAIYHVDEERDCIEADAAGASRALCAGSSEGNEPAAANLGSKQVEGSSPTAAAEDGEVEELQAVGRDAVAQAGVLEDVKLWPIVKKIYPMMLTCCLTFVVTCLMNPGVMIAVNSSDNWYTTLVMAVYNFTDLIGRMLTVWKRLWPSRKWVIILSVCRIGFIPLLVLCAKHVIPSEAAAYVFTGLMGVTTGFFGTISMVLSSESPGLKTDAERSCAGQLTGVALLAGCSIGSLLQIAIVLGL